MNFLETWSELDKLHEWQYINRPSQSTNTQNNSSGMKNYEVTYYEDGVRKSFTVTARSKSEAEDLAWYKVDADSVYVSELDEEFGQDATKE